MRVAIGSDHAGFELKEILKTLLDGMTVQYDDVGTTSTTSVDYPDYAALVAHAVVGGRADLGILVCGTGIGMSIAANKIPGVRAAVVCDETTATLSRAHNNANILCLGGRTTPRERVGAILRAFLSTPFDDGRHTLRLDKIARLEREDS